MSFIRRIKHRLFAQEPVLADTPTPEIVEPPEPTFTFEAAPSLPSIHPQLLDWPLLKRIEHVTQTLNPSAHHAPPRYAHQHPGKTDERPVLTIKAADFDEETLLSTLALLADRGGELYLPAGTVILKQALRLPSHTRIVGVEGRTTLIFDNVDYPIVVQGTHEQPMMQVRLEQLQIRHRGEHLFCASIFVTHAQHCSFHDVQVIAPRGTGFLLSDHVRNTHFERCRVVDAGLGGFMLVRSVDETLMQSCIVERCQQSGLFLTDLKLPENVDPLDFDAQIHHTINVVGNFAPFAPEDPGPCRTDLHDCVFRHNRKMGITTDGTGLLSIRNCIIAENDCEGITLDNGTWQAHIQNCHIVGNGWRGLQDDAELNTDFVDEMGLMDDGASKAKLPGVSLDNAAYCRIENNLIENNWGDGIKFVRANYQNIISHNTVLNNNRGQNDRFHFFGILIGAAERQHPEQTDFESSDNLISHNQVIGAHHAGIHLLRTVHSNRVEGNYIEGAVSHPIEDHSEDHISEWGEPNQVINNQIAHDFAAIKAELARQAEEREKAKAAEQAQEQLARDEERSN